MDYHCRNIKVLSQIQRLLRFRVWPCQKIGHLWPSDIILHDRKRPQGRNDLSEWASERQMGPWRGSQSPRPTSSAPFTRSEFWDRGLSVKTQEAFIMRKSVGHKTHTVLFQGPGDQMWHNKTETSNFPILWGDSRGWVWRSLQGPYSHVTPGAGKCLWMRKHLSMPGSWQSNSGRVDTQAPSEPWPRPLLTNQGVKDGMEIFIMQLENTGQRFPKLNVILETFASLSKRSSVYASDDVTWKHNSIFFLT